MPEGTLRKRKRRNITKVGSLGIVPYDEAEDRIIEESLFTNAQNQTGNPFILRSQFDTTLRMNSSNLKSSRSRVTRNPDFHSPDLHEEVDEVMRSAWSGHNTTNSNFSKEERSHFIDKTSMNWLKRILLLGMASMTFPWKWNSKEWKIEKYSPTLELIWKLLYACSLVQTTGITLFQIYMFAHGVSSGSHESYRVTFMSSFSVLWYVYCLLYNFTFILYKEQIRSYINTMLSFNKDYTEKYLIHLDGLKDGGRIIINLAIPSNCFQILVSCTYFLVMPYQPWYLFSYIYPKPWYWLIPGVIQEFIKLGQVLTCYLLVSWIVVAHCNTVQFWLGEIHNHNESDYTTDDIRHPKVSMDTYKSLQILCNLFNNCLAPVAIPLTKFTIFTALIPCGYVLIRSMNHVFIDEFPGIMTYPVSVLDCGTVGFGMLTMGAKMHDLASSFLDSWSQTKSKNLRRLLMSLPCLRMEVGKLYFVSVSTTITFFKMIFDYITDCIITFP